MEVLQTPLDRFDAVPDFSYEAHLQPVPGADGTTVHLAWYEAGAPDAPTVLLTHAAMSWSFTNRRLMAALADAGLRAVAVDLLGYGRSDKPTDDFLVTPVHQDEPLDHLLLDLDLTEVTLYASGYGGITAQRLLSRHPDRFRGLIVSEAALPTGYEPVTELVTSLIETSLKAPALDVGMLAALLCGHEISEVVRAAYDAPYPDRTYQAAVRSVLRETVTEPTQPEAIANAAALDVLADLDLPVLGLFAEQSAIFGTPGAMLLGEYGNVVRTVTFPGLFPLLEERVPKELCAEVVRFAREVNGAD